MGQPADDRPPALRTELEKATELREKSLALAARALETQVAARQLHEKRFQAKQDREVTLETSMELRREAAELRSRIADYAATLRRLGQSPAQTIDEAWNIAEQTIRLVARTIPVQPFEREKFSRDVVLWAIDGYVTM